jgi:hypothetical protein
MISLGKDKYKPVLKEMWKLCFPGDTNTFIKFYFNEVYKDDEMLVYLENGKPAAALQMIPYSLKKDDEIFRAGYISGAMTHPDSRRKRFMRELLLTSFDIMRERGFDYTFLIPQEKWLFDFYGKFGYKTAVPASLPAKHKESSQSSNNQCHIYKRMPDQNRIDKFIYPAYFRLLSEIPQVVLKTKEQFRLILRDFFDEDGILFVDERGIAFTLKEKNHIVFKEFFYQSSQIRDLLLKTISDYYPQEEILILNSSDKLPGKRGMIKRLNNNRPEIPALYINMMLD